MKREFLGWNRPPLHSAADWLLKNFARESTWDLSSAIVVLPTSRAARRLLELLVITAAEKKLTLSPPKIETLGNLPEHLYKQQKAFASEISQIQAMIAALRATPKETLAHLVPFPPGPKEHAAWRSLAKLILDTHRELASDRVTFRKVADEALKLGQKEESERWIAMDAILQKYFLTLDELKLWDRQTARLVALDKEEYATEKQIILIAAADLNRTQRAILDHISNQVTILVAAPKDNASGFDEHGALEPESWCESNIEIPESAIKVVSKPIDQAFAAVASISELAKTQPVVDIVVGVVDKDIAPLLESSLKQAGAQPHRADGIPLSRTSPFLLLKSIADWLREPTARHLAALARHPQVYAWLTLHDAETLRANQSSDPQNFADLLTRLDKCIVDRLIDAIPRDPKSREKFGMVAQLAASVDSVLAELSGSPRAIGDWVEPLTKLLVKLAEADCPTGEAPIAIWRAFADACSSAWEDWQSLDASLSPKIPAPEAIDLLCEAIESTIANTAYDSSALHLLGWLDLPLDDAPAAVVTGFNEGRVPSALHGDVFLPNTLRVALKLTDNRRRLARDAYALRLLLESKKSVTLIAGRLDHAGDPLLPSRLLFFSSPSEAATRVRLLYAKKQPAPRPRPALISRQKELVHSAFIIPKPRLERVAEDYPQKMRVTKFRDFLACGYRYYLKEIERLEAIADEAEELAPNRFGDILHTVLSQFGDDAKMRAESNRSKIEGHLNALLDLHVLTAVSDSRHPAFAVQIEQLRLRLGAFANWQAQWRDRGYEIIHTEEELGGAKKGVKHAFLDVDGSDVELLGRIDRIDRHKTTKEVVVFDYKSADEAKTPERAHDHGAKKSGFARWRDLQLPLYQVLAASLGYTDYVKLGYIVLPKKSADTGERLAKWTEKDLTDAHETAREVIRAIREQEFPLKTPPPDYSEDFAPICQDRTLRDWAKGEVLE